jgi:hypothetical protein
VRGPRVQGPQLETYELGENMKFHNRMSFSRSQAPCVPYPWQVWVLCASWRTRKALDGFVWVGDALATQAGARPRDGTRKLVRS